MKYFGLILLLSMSSYSHAETVQNFTISSEQSGIVMYIWQGILSPNDPNFDKIHTQHWGKRDSNFEHSAHSDIDAISKSAVTVHTSPTFELVPVTHRYCSVLSPLNSFFDRPWTESSRRCCSRRLRKYLL